MKLIKLVLLFLVLIVLPVIYAETITLEYSEENWDKSGIDFDTGRLSSYEDSDLGFRGEEDKDDGMDAPILITDNSDGAIALRNSGEQCSSLDGERYGDQEARIIINQEYCLRTKDGSGYVGLTVKELADDWSSVGVEWEVLSDDSVGETTEEAAVVTEEIILTTETTEDSSSVETTIETTVEKKFEEGYFVEEIGFETETTVPEKISETVVEETKTTLPEKEQEKDSSWVIILIIDIVLLYVVVLLFNQIKKRRKEIDDELK